MGIGTILFKAMVARELLNHGPMNMQEFNDTINKVINTLRLSGYDIDDDTIVQVVNLISVRNGKITLSNDGLKYLEAFNLIPNQFT